MSNLSAHIKRIRSGSLLSFSKKLRDMEVSDRIETVLDVMLFDADLNERLISDRASRSYSRLKALPSASASKPAAAHSTCSKKGPIKGLLAPNFFPGSKILRIQPIGL